MAASLLTLLAAGCSTLSNFDPVGWWHDLEGGPIADARPPPPGVDQPYPNLADTPDRPANLDAARRGQIANALVADRANAQYDASLAPLPAAGKPLPQPAKVAPLPAAPTDSEASNASLEAASAPPPPPPPKRAPTPPVQAVPLAPPVPAGDALPPVPDQPPAPPALPGIAQSTTPTPPKPTPPAPKPAPPVKVAGAPDAVAFTAGSAALSGDAMAGLRTLARQRGAGSIAVVGYGEASGTEPAAQQAAIPLALARAKAIAAYLESVGVPAAAIRVDAEAAGQGGAARLIR